MDYGEALKKLLAFRKLMEELRARQRQSPSPQLIKLRQDFAVMYGEVAEVIELIVGRNEIRVPVAGDAPPMVFPNYIEAGYLSGRTFHTHQGYTQLLAVIGTVKQRAENMPVSPNDCSITHIAQVLRRFRECCQYVEKPPAAEIDVQRTLWIMLRSHFDRLEREETLPPFGVKAYRPDFGIPDLRVLIEVKYIGTKTTTTAIQEGILADVPGYLGQQTQYDGVIVFVYDAAQKLRDPRRFIEDLRSVEGIIEVLVVPGMG